MSSIYQSLKSAKRVAVFVDGNNLFYGIYDIGWQDVLWTDLRELGSRIAKSVSPESSVAYVKHFTARPHEVEGSKLKPNLWLDFTTANYLHSGVEVIQGRFVKRGGFRQFEEKETDANLAAHLCTDALKRRFDVAVVITADTDFVGTFRYFAQEIPDIPLVLGLPPELHGGRQSRKLMKSANQCVTISRAMLNQSLLPDVVRDPATGREYRKPTLRAWVADQP